jgi:hypothetical protein
MHDRPAGRIQSASLATAGHAHSLSEATPWTLPILLDSNRQSHDSDTASRSPAFHGQRARKEWFDGIGGWGRRVQRKLTATDPHDVRGLCLVGAEGTFIALSN